MRGWGLSWVFVEFHIVQPLGRDFRLWLKKPLEQISFLGKEILKEVKPEPEQSEVSALDGRMYEAVGPRWHKKDRPQWSDSRLDWGMLTPQSYWSKSGYRGWIQGYRLVVQGLVFPEPVPVFAAWRSNAIGEITIAKEELSSGRIEGHRCLSCRWIFQRQRLPCWLCARRWLDVDLWCALSKDLLVGRKTSMIIAKRQ